MLLQDLYRILLDKEEIVLCSHKSYECLWEGEVKDIPSCFFDKIVTSLYLLNASIDSYLIINIIE